MSIEDRTPNFFEAIWREPDSACRHAVQTISSPIFYVDVLRVVVEDPLNCLQSFTLSRVFQRILREKDFTNFLKGFFLIDFAMVRAIFSFSYVSVLEKISAQLDDLSIFHSHCKKWLLAGTARFESERTFAIENAR
jgi:hypothetical protein